MDSIQNLRDCADVALVGGKAANLGALLRAGFVVPDGFVMTTAARDADLGSIRAAYRDLNAPAVAVRSSATIEDTETVSMAGQFKTILNVRNEAELIDAVQLCRASLAPSNSFVYSNEAPMPLVIQSQVAADVAGVLFTQSPQNPDEMLIEAAPGLGDHVVSGRTQPDIFRVNCETGQILESRSRHEVSSLTSEQVKKLWKLGRKVASHFGIPQDIEWAISGDELFLLQARPITTSDRALIRTNLIRSARQRLSDSERGPWVLHNLAETVPHPAPLTWSILRKFMSGAGGFGAMYRRLGFDPASAEVLELVLGKIYLDLARAPGLFGKEFPFAYDTELLRRDANASQLPPSLPRGSWPARFRARRQLREAERKIDIESVDLDQRLRQQIIPRFTQWCAAEKRRDLTCLSTEKWIALWSERERRLFDDFAPQIFFTTFIAASAWRRLQDFVVEHFWDDAPEALTQLFVSSGHPDETLLADAALRAVARGQYSLGEWLERYGHRGIGEFDLAAPRWREIPDALLAYAERLKNTPDPIDLHRKRTEQARQKIHQLPGRAARELEKRIDLARRYLVFREDGKHYLMLGYDLLRDLMLEASRRLRSDVAWLTADELAKALRQGFAPQPRIDQRRREFLAEARINLPRWIDVSALSSLGQPPKFESHQRFEGLPISNGFASGPVRIVESPLHARHLGKDYVLVCPSTDPQWTPLFLNASALVLGCGGSLSHGAIAAREMNLPAVVLPNATQLLRENEEIFVDGSSGLISRKPNETHSNATNATVVPEKLPPVPGKRERRGAQIRNAGFIFWGIFLLAAWSLPEKWLYLPSLHILDLLLWPMVTSLGRPASVAIIGAGAACIAALMQALFADNVRVGEARRRARDLGKEAATLPAGSARHEAVTSIARSVHLRITGAGLVPIGMLLGIFILGFAWLVARMDQSNPLPGTPARVLARINADFREAVTLRVSPPLRLDESSPASRSLPPIRETLNKLAAKNRLTAFERDDLQHYLRRGVPRQTLTWLVRSDTPGSFPITIVLGKQRPVHHSVVFGDQSPPPFDQVIRHHPLDLIKVESVGGKSALWHFANRDITWPWIYLGAYLPVWLVGRRLLRLV